MNGGARVLAAVAVILLLLPFAVARADSLCPSQWHVHQPAGSALQICWRLDDDRLSVQMSHPGRVWMALGFGETMSGADAVIGRLHTGEVSDVFIGGYDADSIRPDARQNISEPSVVFDGEHTVMKFSRALDTGDKTDYVIVSGQPTPLIWAVGVAPEFTGHFARGAIRINRVDGASYVWQTKTLWHAVLMSVAWLLMMPLGIIIARYYKVLPQQDYPRVLDNRFWWRWHLLLQYGGMLFAVIGFFVLYDPQKNIGGMHTIVGIIALLLGVCQVAGGLLRGSKGGPTDDKGQANSAEKIRGDHYDMSRRRRVFELCHKSGGYAALAAGGIAGALGLWQTQAHWAWSAALAVWVVLMALWFLRLHKSGRWVETYQAIWGPDTRHPGNRDGDGKARQQQNGGV